MHETSIHISHPLIASTCLWNACFFQASHSDRLWIFRNNSSPFNLVLICRASEKHQLSSPPVNLQCTSIFPPFSMPANSFHGNSGFEGSITSVKLLSPALRADVCAAPIAQLCTAQPNATDERKKTNRREKAKRRFSHASAPVVNESLSVIQSFPPDFLSRASEPQTEGFHQTHQKPAKARPSQAASGTSYRASRARRMTG